MKLRQWMPATLLVSSMAAINAQTTPPVVRVNQAQTPLIKSDTRAVSVDIVVTRGIDDPVGGLHKQDFQLTEDGKPQVIDFFEEHAAPQVPAHIAPLPALPPHVFTNVPAAPQSDAVNVLLLDSLNTPQQDQSVMRQQLIEFLKTMKPDARIAVFALGNGLRLIQGFSDDPAVLRAAVENKKFGFAPVTTDVSRSHQDDEDDAAEVARRQANLGGAGRTTAGISALMEGQASHAEFQGDQRVDMTLDALQGLGRYLASIPGRKNLIWFASQYPVDFFPKGFDKQPFNDRREHTQAIKQTANLLTLSKVAVYPIDAEGMMRNYKEDAEHWENPKMSGYQNMSGERASTMSAMELIASETGGEAIFNNNDLGAALSRAIHNGEHYYTVVYTPTNKEMNGQFRKIDVKLQQTHYKLSYRRGYYADDQKAPTITKASKDESKAAAQEADARIAHLRSLLGRGMPSATEILYGVRVEPAATQPASGAKPAGANTKLAGPTTRYTADFLVDPNKLKLVPTANGEHSGWIRVELVAYDHDGKPLNWTGATLRSKLDAATYASMEKSGVPVHMEIDVPRGDAYLATGIYDLQADRVGTLEIPLGDSSIVAKK